MVQEMTIRDFYLFSIPHKLALVSCILKTKIFNFLNLMNILLFYLFYNNSLNKTGIFVNSNLPPI